MRPDGLDALAARESAAGTVGWYATDRQGSVRLNLDASGAVTNRITYDAYGQVVSQTNASAGDRFKYTGGEEQGDLQAVLLDHRWYDPRTRDGGRARTRLGLTQGTPTPIGMWRTAPPTERPHRAISDCL